MDPITNPKMKTAKGKGVETHSLAHSILGVKGRVEALRWRLKRLINNLITHTDLHKPNNKLANVQLEHLWCTNELRVDIDSQNSPWPGLGGSHHLPFYNILCAWPRGQHPNVILSQDSQMGVPKLPKLGFLWLWKPITLRADLWLRWDLKQSCSPHWELFNIMLHATYTQVSQSNSQLLMVKSQIGNLTPEPSFDHNLCFNHSNGSCKPILDIYVPRDFQWYKKLQNLIRFWPL
jgi:hypothetical protein